MKKYLYIISLLFVLGPLSMASEWTREEAIDLYKELESASSIRAVGDVIFIGDERFKVKIEKDQSLSFEPVAEDENTVHGLASSNCSEEDYAEEGEWPKNVKLVCNDNKEFVIAIYKKPDEDLIVVEGRLKGKKEPHILKEIEGKSIHLASGFSSNGYNKYNNYFCFYVSDEPHGFNYGKAKYLAVIDVQQGVLNGIELELSMEAKPYVDDGGDVFYVGTDGDLYTYSPGRPEFLRHKVWRNAEGVEIVAMGSSSVGCSGIYFLKLRKEGRDYYKFFRYNEYSFCEISTEYGIASVDFIYPNYHDPNRLDKYGREIRPGALAFIEKKSEDNNQPSKLYIRRWYKEFPELFSELSNKENLFNRKSLDVARGVFESLLKAVDALAGKRDWDPTEFSSMCLALDDQIMETEVLFKDFGAGLKYNAFSKPFSVRVKNPVDGMEIPVNIWPPHDLEGNEPKPAIVHIHGGPNAHEDLDFNGMNLMKQYYASRGFWVIVPEPRGSTGYGEAHEKALANEWNGKHLDDVIAALDYVKGAYNINEEAVFLMGLSFGGYATLAMATHPEFSKLFAGYAPISMLSNVGKQIKEDSEFEGRNYYIVPTLESWATRVGFDPTNNWRHNEKNKEVSPYYHLDSITKPVLQIHGTNDNTTFPSQTLNVHHKAYELGLPVKTVMIEDMGHYFGGKNGFLGGVELPMKFFKSIMEGTYDASPQKEPEYVHDVESLLEETK